MERIKCITFNKTAQDNLPQDIKDKMKADRENTIKQQENKGLNIPVVMGSASRMPESFFEFSGDELMSNFDRQIITETANEIKGKELFSRYAGWDFNGKVWWQNDKWLCEVWCWGRFRETFVCDTLEDIMEEVSSEYGFG